MSSDMECPHCEGKGGTYADSYEGGEIAGQMWVRCIHCGGEGCIRGSDEEE